MNMWQSNKDIRQS